MSHAELLRDHYVAVRARLGIPPPGVVVPARRRDPSRLYATRYEAPIGPQRVIFLTAVDRPIVLDSKHMTKRHERDFMVETCEACGVGFSELLGESKRKELIKARAIIAHYLAGSGRSSVYIGRRLNRDHSSILSLLKNYTANGERARG